MNLAHRLNLLEAGDFALNHKADEKAVRDKFNEAIQQATRIGSRQDAALANWHAGEYFLTKKKDGDWASYYVNKVHWLYRDWEAHWMCEYLKSKYVDKVNIYWDSQARRSTTRYSRLHSITEQVNIDTVAVSLWDGSVGLGGIHRSDHYSTTRGKVGREFLRFGY